VIRETETRKTTREFSVALKAGSASPWRAVASAKAAKDDVSLVVEGAKFFGGEAVFVSQRVEGNAFHLRSMHFGPRLANAN
jgi:hypothetical protein